MVLDTAEAVLLFVLVVLTILLIVLGVQVFFILRELKQTVIKANKVLDDTGTITKSVSGPLATISSITTGVRTGALIARLFKRKTKGVSRKEREEENE